MPEGKQGQLSGILAAKRFDNGWLCSWPKACRYIRSESFYPTTGGAVKDISFYYEYKSQDAPRPQGNESVISILNVFLFIITFNYPKFITLM